jgi:methionyl-tRNA formyltransferase
MPAGYYSCVLLTSDHPQLAPVAEAHARQLFDVRHVSRHGRSEHQVPSAAREAALSGSVDFLFNFLAPMIVPVDMLSAIRRESINVHPAPPEWPGVGSASYALYAGDATFGVTAHRMTAQVDAGDILRVVRFPIGLDDNCDAVFDRALSRSVSVFIEVCDVLAHDGRLTPSGDRWARPATTRAQFEQWMHISPSDPEEEIARKVRAVRSRRFPGPFVELAGFRFELPPKRDL